MFKDLAFGAYAYHQQKIEDFIDEFINTEDANEAADIVGLNLNDLTSYDIEYINKELAKRG